MIHATQSHGEPAQREQEYLDGWQRSVAELKNYRQRIQVDQQKLSDRVRRSAVEPLLALADNFQSMVTQVPADLQNHTWVKGVVQVAKQLESLLNEYGVTPIEALHAQFDPAYHEAVEEVADTKVASGTVIDVVSPGYKIGNEVIRPARVKVSR